MNLNDAPVLDPQTRLKICKDEVTAHKAASARKQARVELTAQKAAQAHEVEDAVNEASAPLHALEQKRREQRAQAFAHGTKFDSAEIDRQIEQAQRVKDQHQANAQSAADAIALLLAPAHAQAQLEYVAEAKRGAGLRYDLLRALLDVELDGLREDFGRYVRRHARVAAACLAADRFADPQAGRPRVNPPPYAISMRPSVPEIAIPVVPDAARAAALASWEVAVGPLTSEALTEIMKLVE
jgi:hypothetical protein